MKMLGAGLACVLSCPNIASARFGEPPMYTMVELGSIGTNANSVAMAISDPTPAGPIVVGESFSTFSPPTLSWRAVAWRPDVSLEPIDLLSIAQAGNSTINRAQDVSPNGQYIVGLGAFGATGGLRWTFDPVSGTVTGIQSLLGLPGDGSEGIGVNSAGRAAGYSLTDSSTTRGVTWALAPGNDSVAAELLATPRGSGGFRMAREISEPPLEHIVGRCDWSATPTTRPIIWKKSGDVYQMGEIMELLAPLLVHDAVGISPDGSVAVGLGATVADAVGVAWDTVTNDATGYEPVCCAQNVVYDITNDGLAVGYTAINFQVFRAYLWIDGVPYDLNTRIANNPDIGDSTFLHVATGINSAGQIVGMFGGESSEEPLSSGRVFILTPVKSAIPGDLNGDGTVGPADLADLLAQWGSCPPPEVGQCTADISPAPHGDGTVGPGDLAELLANWSA
jgi:hypothetical protein